MSLSPLIVSHIAAQPAVHHR